MHSTLSVALCLLITEHFCQMHQIGQDGQRGPSGLSPQHVACHQLQMKTSNLVMAMCFKICKAGTNYIPLTARQSCSVELLGAGNFLSKKFCLASGCATFLCLFCMASFEPYILAFFSFARRLFLVIAQTPPNSFPVKSKMVYLYDIEWHALWKLTFFRFCMLSCSFKCNKSIC